MNDQRLLSSYGLKWNPFSPEVPIEGLLVTPAIEQFQWRVGNLARSGGFALITADPGLGKSVALRLLTDRLDQERELIVGVLTRPQSNVADFYRELGELFDVNLSPCNRWGGAKVLRQRWLAHINSVLLRPVLLIDEAQEMSPVAMNELRLLSAADLDSRSLLTVVFAGDARLTNKLKTAELLPLGTRIRVRPNLQPGTPKDLADCLVHAITQAGNANIMTDELIVTLTEHAVGNYRILMTMANELLDAAMQRKIKQLDEKLYLDCFAVPSTPKRSSKRGGGVSRLFSEAGGGPSNSLITPPSNSVIRLTVTRIPVPTISSASAAWVTTACLSGQSLSAWT